jgi:predicted enzyme related to lactoylglutathione lyase
MSTSFPQLARMTLATTRTEEMVKFYDTLFQTNLQANVAFGTIIYRGTFAGIPLMICPNEVAGVNANAEQSRHQLALRVANFSTVLSLVESTGGVIERESTDRAILRDPDGNTLEVIQG